MKIVSLIKHTLSLLFVLSMSTVLYAQQVSYAQNIRPGTYIGSYDKNVLIISEDSICYRLQTSWGLTLHTIGIGSYQYKDRIVDVDNNCNLIDSALSSLSEIKRQDTCLSFRMVDADGEPIRFACVWITENDASENKQMNWFKRWLSKLKKTDEVTVCSDEDGWLDASFLASFVNKSISMHLKDVGFEAKTIVNLNTGYDYELKVNMTTNIGYGVCKKEHVKWNIVPLEDGTIQFICVDIEDCKHVSTMVRISDYSEMDCELLLKDERQIREAIRLAKQNIGGR